MAGAGAGSFQQGSSDSCAAKTLPDPRDYKFPQMPFTCSALHLSKWRHDGLNDLDVHDRWSSGTAFLHEIRQQRVEVTQAIFDAVVLAVNQAGRVEHGQDTVK